MNFLTLLSLMTTLCILQLQRVEASDCDYIKSAFTEVKENYSWLKNVNKCCSQNPFTCNSKDEITEINLSSIKLNITLSNNLGKLSNLKKLSLGGTGLTGSIPKEIYTLSNLEVLELNDNKLNGEITEDIKNLINLKTLNLKNNEFNGEIPKSISEIKNLTYIDISKNKLSGVVPLTKELEFCNFEENALCSDTKLSCSTTLPLCQKASNNVESGENKATGDESSGNTTTYIIIGVIVVLVVIVAVVIFVVRSNKKSKKQEEEPMETAAASTAAAASTTAATAIAPTKADDMVEEIVVREANTSAEVKDSLVNTSMVSETFVLPDIEETIKDDFVDELLGSNPTLLRNFISIDRIKTAEKEEKPENGPSSLSKEINIKDESENEIRIDMERGPLGSHKDDQEEEEEEEEKNSSMSNEGDAMVVENKDINENENVIVNITNEK